MHYLKWIALSCLLTFIGLTTQAQILNHQLGEFIIKTNHNTTRLEQTYAQWLGHPTGFKMERVLSHELDIYLFSFDYNQIPETDFLRELQSSPFIETIQLNHILKNRLIPNDTQFDSQWQYINTGQSGGTAGADIDMELAWDITTGGVTVLGDTIVAAIIDDGFDFNHSDFGDNIWVNYAEIPNDNVDNDNNGYVDDYLGWNAYNEDDNITGGGHGTPVTGIVGAQGNNNLGVSGVNWDVKLMIIQGGGAEADAIAAYSYCYTQRKRYNETNGAEGAYVVTTNASWGVDYGQPANSPLWCSFYDSLGAEGIISCGATINGDANVDIEGDLPTACSSDYLISVTNMNHNDQKVLQAGYGTTTIDLGAFGEGTWTAAFNDSYGGFGGTSGATPHVTGVTALMHAAPCPSFATLAKSDPAAAALLIKQYILDGTDPNASLSGITVTGGRLNAFNAVNAIMMNCDSSSCIAPYSVTTYNTTDTATDIEWTTTSDSAIVNFRYREAGTNNWIEQTNVSSPYTLSNLLACTEYEFQLQSICSADTSDWTATAFINTDGCCEAPVSLSTSNITENTATLSWPSVLAAFAYSVRYRPVGAANWMENSAITDTNVTLTNLQECTQYEAQIRSFCFNNDVTPFSSSYTFSTVGCGGCIDLTYCPSSSQGVPTEYIGTFNLGTINNVSGLDEGYGDYTGISTDLQQGASYDISIVPEFPVTTYSEYYLVWIDYNQNGTFDLPEEVAYDSDGLTQTTATGVVNIPTDALLGSTRLRVSMRWMQAGEPCLDNFDYGEVEDYCVNIIANTGVNCGNITNMMVTNTTEMTASIDWEDVTDATNYEFQYRLVGETEWQDEALTTSEVSLTGLMACSEYEYRARVFCGNDFSTYTATSTFTTTCPPCDVVTTITVVDSTETSLSMEWAAVSNADSYLMQYRMAGTTNWLDMSFTTAEGTLENLSACESYECRIMVDCVNNESDWSEIFEFNTLCSTGLYEADLSFALYPNPAHNYLQVEMEQTSPWTYRFIGMDGKVLMSGEATTAQKRIDIAHLPAGVYWMEIIQDGNKGFKRCVKF